jgi:hypothetical protein
LERVDGVVQGDLLKVHDVLEWLGRRNSSTWTPPKTDVAA